MEGVHKSMGSITRIARIELMLLWTLLIALTNLFVRHTTKFAKSSKYRQNILRILCFSLALVFSSFLTVEYAIYKGFRHIALTLHIVEFLAAMMFAYTCYKIKYKR
jgi:hypothetical protein